MLPLLLAKFFTAKSPLKTSPTSYIIVYMIVMDVIDVLLIVPFHVREI